MMKVTVNLRPGRILCFAALLAFSVPAARAQDAASRLDKYEALAAESVEVTLDGPVLRLAAAALSDKDPDEKRIKALVGDIRSIRVRVFEFEREGAYDRADLDALRAQFRGPGWSRVADVKSGRYENVEVYVSTDGAVIRGLSVIASDSRELAFVQIDGAISPERLSELEGRFSVPRMKLSIRVKE
jgi:hypothetical protein